MIFTFITNVLYIHLYVRLRNIDDREDRLSGLTNKMIKEAESAIMSVGGELERLLVPILDVIKDFKGNNKK